MFLACNIWCHPEFSSEVAMLGCVSSPSGDCVLLDVEQHPVAEEIFFCLTAELHDWFRGVLNTYAALQASCPCCLYCNLHARICDGVKFALNLWMHCPKSCCMQRIAYFVGGSQ